MTVPCAFVVRLIHGDAERAAQFAAVAKTDGERQGPRGFREIAANARGHAKPGHDLVGPDATTSLSQKPGARLNDTVESTNWPR
jgi:hypothetical protein